MSYTFGSCGFIATGSSVVSDFLKEFDENQAIDKFEFKIGYQTDGLLDLKYHLFEGNMKYESGSVAISRFRSMIKSKACNSYRELSNNKFNQYADEFIDNVVQGQWLGTSADPILEPKRNWMIRALKKVKFFRMHNKLEVKKGKDIKCYPLKKVEFSINPENFDDEAKKFTSKMLLAMGRNPEKNVVLDQPFPGNDPKAVFAFYENPKAIVVDRDPRDLFLIYTVIGYARGNRQYPVRDVETFVKLYRNMRDNQPYKISDENVMLLQYEDMIYKYEETSAKLAGFCGVSKHTNPKKYFNPEMSINNTQLFRRYKGYEKQIEYIEANLKDYLYDFSPYYDKNISFGNPFGDNPLNPVGKKWKRQ